MNNIDSLCDKLNMLYNNCVMLCRESCVCQDNLGIYRLYVSNRHDNKRYSRYSEFVKLNKDINKYKCINGRLYGLCDNLGNDVTDNKYEDIAAINGDYAVIKEVGLDYGLVDLRDMDNIIEGKYSSISMYKGIDFVVTRLGYYGISELYGYDGKRLLNVRYSNIIITDKVLICSIDDPLDSIYDFYDYKMGLLASCRRGSNIYNDNGLISIDAVIDGKDIHWSNLKIKEEIKKKEGLGI